MSTEDSILNASAPDPEKHQHPGAKLDPAPEGEVAATDKGDSYDEDMGTYLGTLSVGPDIPANISVFMEGHWYVYKMDRKYKEGEQ